MPSGRKKLLTCCVPNCDSREDLFGDENSVKLYKFPSEKALMRKWVARIGRGSNFIPTERTRICSRHFQSGKKSYRPTHLDYIPSVFWYNKPKTSEYCSGCRRKICKCNQAEEPLNNCNASDGNGTVFIEKEVFQLLETIEAENQEYDNDDGKNHIVNPPISTNTSFDLSKVQLMENDQDHGGDSNVTVAAIALFLADSQPYIPRQDELINVHVEMDGPTTNNDEVEHEIEFGSIFQEHEVLQAESQTLERTNVDETIECVLRGEDSVGDDILYQQYLIFRYPPKPDNEYEKFMLSLAPKLKRISEKSPLKASDLQLKFQQLIFECECELN